MNRLKNAFIMPVDALFYDGGDSYLVSQYCTNGTLADINIREYNAVEQRCIWQQASYQLLSAVDYMHMEGTSLML